MRVVDLGITDYREACRIQSEILAKRINGDIPDTLIVTEHEPAVVLGRTSDMKSVRDARYFEKNNIPVIRSSRGGKITYHSPGQMVLYPIVDLKERARDISSYIDELECAVSEGLREMGIPAVRHTERRGVWVEGKKIAFSGISLRKWVTYHGIITNINNDITPFSLIDPCGEKDIEVTSAGAFLGGYLDMEAVKERFVRLFRKSFEKRQKAEVVDR
ncbi:MAG: lipoyl(octanoyl) transferase LipB [Candidatus Omnitrophota bacterium]